MILRIVDNSVSFSSPSAHPLPRPSGTAPHAAPPTHHRSRQRGSTPTMPQPERPWESERFSLAD
jgi:hypothetical protein